MLSKTEQSLLMQKSSLRMLLTAPDERHWGKAAAATSRRRRSRWPTQALSPGTAVQKSGLRSQTCGLRRALTGCFHLSW